MKFKFIVMLSALMLGASNIVNAEITFSVGQEWSYKNRPIDENSTLVIGAKENHPEMGEIIHITVKNVHVSNPNADGGFSNHIGHIPISEESLRLSVRKILNEDVEADGVLEGIEAWRNASGGMFSISAAEAVQYIEEVLSGGEVVSD